MAEYALNLWDYWRIIHKRKWIITSIFVISILSVQVFGKKTEPVYQSTVTLNVDMQQPIAEITGSGVTFWGGTGRGQLATQLELIRSYNLLFKVASQMGLITPESSEEKIQAVISSLRSKISVEKQPNTTLVDISATDTDPVRAKITAEMVAHVFIESNWENKIREATNTKKFVEKQLKKIDQTISDIRAKLEVMGVEPAAGKIPAAGAVNLRIRLTQLEYRLSDLRERYTDNYPGIINILSEIKNIKKHMRDFPEEAEIGERRIHTLDPERLKNELLINEKLYALLKERYEKALILEASKTKGIQIVNPAFIPRKPVAGPVTITFLLAGAIGLVLGLVAAFVTESLDTSIGTIEDVEEYLKIPVLGVIPQIELDKKQEPDYWKKMPSPEDRKESEEIMGRLVLLYRPKSPVSEAYRNLQTYIKFSGLDKVGNCLMFTSAGIQEGKTMTAVNSALSMAQMGYKVVLVDADLRRPAIHKVFGIKREIGLSEAILGSFKLDDVVKTMDDVMLGNIKSSMIMKTYGMENLNIITSGHLPSNSAEVLSSDNMTEVIKELKSKFQVVLFDSAPVLPVTDTCILSPKVDGVIIVYKAGRVSRGALRMCKTQIENAKGKPIGVVLNNMRASDMKFGSPFYYYYEKYYGREEEKSEQKE